MIWSKEFKLFCFLAGLGLFGYKIKLPTPRTYQGQLAIKKVYSLNNINYPFFRIIYSRYHQAPLSVHEVLVKQNISGEVPRERYFYEAEEVSAPFRLTNDHFKLTHAFQRLNLHRGHMAAAGNYSNHPLMKYLSFTYANVVPQNGTNNTGIWNTFERYARKLTQFKECKTVQVISGPVYSNEENAEEISPGVKRREMTVLLKNGAVVPPRLYKIIQCNGKNEVNYASGFMFLNAATNDNDKTLEEFEVPIRVIEQATGFQFTLNADQSLRAIDPVGMSSTKRDQDIEFYEQLLKNCGSLSEMKDTFRRVKEQKLFVNLNNFRSEAKIVAEKEAREIITDTIGPCHKLYALMKLQRCLGFINQKELFDNKLKEEQQPYFNECRLSKSEDSRQADYHARIVNQWKSEGSKPFSYANQSMFEQI